VPTETGAGVCGTTEGVAVPGFVGISDARVGANAADGSTGGAADFFCSYDSRAPQDMQNFVPSGCSSWQRGHFVTD
jgi:hypothetical protein